MRAGREAPPGPRCRIGPAYEVVQALGQELPQVSPVLHIRTVSVAGVPSMKVMSSPKGSVSSVVARSGCAGAVGVAVTPIE